MKITEMKPEDLKYVLRNPMDPDSVLGEFVPLHKAYSAWYDGSVVGVGGINWLWSGVGEAWVLFSKDVKHCKFGIYRATKRILSQYDSYQRIQATARVDSPVSCKMLEKLGFEMEGKLRQYSPDGTDNFLYSMVK